MIVNAELEADTATAPWMEKSEAHSKQISTQTDFY